MFFKQVNQHSPARRASPGPQEHTGGNCYLHSKDIPAHGFQSELKFRFTKRASKADISILKEIGFYLIDGLSPLAGLWLFTLAVTARSP